jgi:hypothetical protein
MNMYSLPRSPYNKLRGRSFFEPNSDSSLLRFTIILLIVHYLILPSLTNTIVLMLFVFVKKLFQIPLQQD